MSPAPDNLAAVFVFATVLVGGIGLVMTGDGDDPPWFLLGLGFGFFCSAIIIAAITHLRIV